jgi:folate-binding protein YgfZ
MIHWQEFGERYSKLVVSGNFLCSADDLGLILVSGADAGEFLQNQLSNDIDLIDESSLQISSYSTPKGRMLGIFRVVSVSNGYILMTPRPMVVSLLQQLFKYVLRSQVTLADASDYFARFALQTDDAELLAHSSLPGRVNAVIQTDTLITMRLDPLGSQQRFVFLCLSADEAIGLWKGFSSRLQVAGYASWHLSEIRTGMPSIHPETAGEFVLQMANLGALGGVSFRKGCYPGQEIVARMQYLGKLKRRMYLAELETDQLPRPGDELVATGKSEVDGSGKVVDAEFDPEGLCHCLYVAQIAKADAGELHLLSQPEIRIRNVDLPYSLEN